MTRDVEQEPTRGIKPGAVAAGAVLLALGVLMLLDTTGTLRVNTGQLIAPIVLIAMGSSILLNRGCRGKHGGGRPGIGGLWLLGLGVWMLVSQMHLFGLSYGTSWPLLLIMAGMVVVLRGMR